MAAVQDDRDSLAGALRAAEDARRLLQAFEAAQSRSDAVEATPVARTPTATARSSPMSVASNVAVHRGGAGAMARSDSWDTHASASSTSAKLARILQRRGVTVGTPVRSAPATSATPARSAPAMAATPASAMPGTPVHSVADTSVTPGRSVANVSATPAAVSTTAGNVSSHRMEAGATPRQRRGASRLPPARSFTPGSSRRARQPRSAAFGGPNPSVPPSHAVKRSKERRAQLPLTPAQLRRQQPLPRPRQQDPRAQDVGAPQPAPSHLGAQPQRQQEQTGGEASHATSRAGGNGRRGHSGGGVGKSRKPRQWVALDVVDADGESSGQMVEAPTARGMHASPTRSARIAKPSSPAPVASPPQPPPPRAPATGVPPPRAPATGIPPPRASATAVPPPRAAATGVPLPRAPATVAPPPAQTTTVPAVPVSSATAAPVGAPAVPAEAAEAAEAAGADVDGASAAAAAAAADNGDGIPFGMSACTASLAQLDGASLPDPIEIVGPAAAVARYSATLEPVLEQVSPLMALLIRGADMLLVDTSGAPGADDLLDDSPTGSAVLREVVLRVHPKLQHLIIHPPVPAQARNAAGRRDAQTPGVAVTVSAVQSIVCGDVRASLAVTADEARLLAPRLFRLNLPGHETDSDACVEFLAASEDARDEWVVALTFLHELLPSFPAADDHEA